MADNAAKSDTLAGQALGHYRISEKIGEGGTARVYRGRDERLERDVAIKVLPPDALSDESARKRFRKEAVVLSQLNHTNIATIYDFDSEDGMDFIVTEYIAGEGIEEKLVSGAIPEREVVRWGSQLAEGLAAAHEQNIIHRDLKPSNLRIATDGRLKILDFGIAKPIAPLSSEDPTTSPSGSMRFAGTLPYMAPEQVRGEKLDARTDIWAAGAVLYQMATGHRPFPASGLQVADQILHRAPARPSFLNPEISPALEATILKCLDKDPDNRYQSARELAVDLRRTAIPAAREAWQAGPRGRRSRAFLIPGSGVAAIALVAGMYAGLASRKPAGARPRIASLAVLPVKNFSGDPTQDLFADGMTEALIAELAQIKAIKVISRTSVMHYKGTSETLPRIAKELGVDGIVEASVVRFGSRMRMRAQLIDAREDRNVWANRYEREMTDVLEAEPELVKAIAGEIRAQLTPQESERR